MFTLKERIQQKKFDRPGQEGLIALLYANRIIKNHLDTICKNHGISLAQYNILRILKGIYPKGHPRYAIQERLVERAPDITRLIDRMINAGLVERRPGEEDRRRSVAYITPKGIELLDTVSIQIDEFILRFEQTLGNDKLNGLIEAANVIIENL